MIYYLKSLYLEILNNMQKSIIKSNMKKHKPNQKQNISISIFDTLESLQISGQLLTTKLDPHFSKHLSKLLSEYQQLLLTLLSEKNQFELKCQQLAESLLEVKEAEIKLKNKLNKKQTLWNAKEQEMLEEVEIIKKHLEEGKDMWTEQLKKIEEAMKEQEREKQKLRSSYQKRLADIDQELDEIMHLHRQKLDKPIKLGDILPSLFSQEELQEEKLVALGEISERKNEDINIPKITENSEKFDIESKSSLDISIDKLDLKGTQKIVYEKLIELRRRIHKFRDEDSCLTSEEGTLDSLPSDLKSISPSQLENSRKTSAASEIEYGKTVPEAKIIAAVSSKLLKFAGVVFGGKGSNKYRKELTKQLGSEKLSIEEREDIVFNLIHEEGTIKKHDAQIKEQQNEEVSINKDEKAWDNISEIPSEKNKDLGLSQDLENLFSHENIHESSSSEEEEEDAEEDDIIDFSEIKVKNVKEEEEKIEEIQQEKPEVREEYSENSVNISKSIIIPPQSETVIVTSIQSPILKPSIIETNTPLFALEAEEVISSKKKFQQNQREPDLVNLSIVNESNIFFIPTLSLSQERSSSRVRQSSRVQLQPEEELLRRPKINTSQDESSAASLPKISDEIVPIVISSHPSKQKIDRKPISMMSKLPIIPRPPLEPPKKILNVRGRSHQPINPTQNRAPGSPPARRKADSEIRSASPTLANRFRMKRFRDKGMPAFKLGKGFSNPAQPIIARHVNLNNIKVI
ncbi:unnamed protein product [Blepharisma stoltei]|uniref:Uncharacterized protein n=1 Tax=Blepharisma stoltei TaxID=1481888 RepID=A0AAU9JEC8_9CILI|nr:unnamed protein product [Blepharisma stoltei]